MAKKEISIIIRARNALAAGLASAGASLKNCGTSAMHVGAFFVKGFLAAGAALAAFAAKAVTAYAAQEKAEKEAEASLRAYGDEIPKNMERIKAFAAAIQNETGVGDENLISRAARLRLLGVEASQLEQATKATVALAAAGMEESAAMKAVAAAMQGDFQQLTRYLPALKATNSEAEKARIVNDFLTAGYAQQKEKLNTVAGQWGLLKARIGDAWEAIGGVIAQNGALQESLKRVSDAVLTVGNHIATWGGGGGFERATVTALYFFEILRSRFMRISSYVNIAGAAIADGFQTAWNAVQKIWGQGSFGVVSKRTEEALAGLEQQERDHQARMAEIAKRQARGPSAQPQRPAAAAAPAEVINVAQAGFDQEAYDKLQAERENLLRQEVDAEKKAAQEVLQSKLDALEKEQAKREELAGKNIADILAEAKTKKDEDKKFFDDLDKAKRLSNKAGRGTKLSKADQEWLDAFNKLQDARAGVPAGQKAIDDAKAQLQALQDNTTKLTEIKTQLQINDRNLRELMLRN